MGYGTIFKVGGRKCMSKKLEKFCDLNWQQCHHNHWNMTSFTFASISNFIQNLISLQRPYLHNHQKPDNVQTFVNLHICPIMFFCRLYTFFTKSVPAHRGAGQFWAQLDLLNGEQGRNEVRWRQGQETSLPPLCSQMRFFGSKCTELKAIRVTLLRLPAPGQSFPLAPDRGINFRHSHGYKWAWSTVLSLKVAKSCFVA